MKEKKRMTSDKPAGRQKPLPQTEHDAAAGDQTDAGAFFAGSVDLTINGISGVTQEIQPITVRDLLQDIYALPMSEEQKNDRRYLLAEILGTEKARLILCSQQVLTAKELDRFRQGSQQMADDVPVHYVINKKNFMGLDFFVDKRVLIPRFDTEILVEKVMDDVLAMAMERTGNDVSLLPADRNPGEPGFDILELCTGSGAIAVSLAALLPAELETLVLPGLSGMSSHHGGADTKCTDTLDPAKKTFPATNASLSGCPAIRILATDLSPEALEVAKTNASRLLSPAPLLDGPLAPPASSGIACPGSQPGAGIDTARPRQAVHLDFARGDLFQAVPAGRRFDLIIANPPYISPQEYPDLDDQVKQEPYMALVADNDGLAIYERILQQAAAYLNPGGKIYLEIGSGQAESLRRLGQSYGWSGYQCLKDHAGHDRVVILFA